MHAHVLKEHLLVGVVQVGNVSFRLGADGNHRSIFLGGIFLDGIKKGIALKAVLLDVGDVHRRLHREKEKLTDDDLLFIGKRHGACRESFVEHGLELFENLHELEGFLVAARTGLL